MQQIARKKLQRLLLVYALLFAMGTIILGACDSDSIVPMAAVSTTTAVSQTAQPISTESKTSPSIQSGNTTANINNSKTVTPGLQIVTPTPILTTQLTEDWQDRWLKAIPCKAPCWEGITPGKTTPDETIQLLNQNPLIARPKMSLSANPKDPIQSITWYWAVSPGRNGGEINFFSNTQNPVVRSIKPNINKEYNLQDIIATYGEPSHVLALFVINPDFSTSYELRIIYLTQGFTLAQSYSIKKNDKTRPEFNTSTFFSLFEFFEPTTDGTTEYKGGMQVKPGILIPWDGFKGFAYYCRDASTNGQKDCSRVLDY